MHLTRLNTAVLCAVIFQVSPCNADDQNVTVVGPTGISSVGVSMGYSRFQYDVRNRGTFIGNATETDNSVSISGSLAINERLSINASVPWIFNQRYSSNFFGNSFTNERPNDTGYSIGVAALLLGAVERSGFRLTGHVGTQRLNQSEGFVYNSSLSAQYWKDPSLGASLLVGAEKVSDYPASVYSQITVIWRTTPRLTISPSFGYSYLPFRDALSSTRAMYIGLGASYAVDKDWTIFARGSGGVRKPQYTYYETGYEHIRYGDFSLGVRKSF
jgi:hypothetical protein